MKRTWASLAAATLLGMLVMTAGCWPKTYTVAIRYARPAQVQAPASVRRAGVAAFTGQTSRDRRFGEAAADRLVSRLGEYNRAFQRFELVDRQALASVLAGKGLHLTVSDIDSAVQAGKAANVDAMIYGSVTVTQSDTEGTRTTTNVLTGKTKTEPCTRRVVSAVVSFAFDNVLTRETIVAPAITKRYDSEKDKSPPDDDVALKLVEQAADEFVAIISPHVVEATEELAEGRSSSVSRGNRLADAGEYSEALALYLKALASDAGDAGAAFNAGVICEKTGKYARAVECYAKAVASDANNRQYAAALERVRRHVPRQP